MSEVQDEARKIEGMAAAFVHMDGKTQASRDASDHIFTETDNFLKSHPGALNEMQAQFNADSTANKYLPEIRVDQYGMMVKPSDADTQQPRAVFMRSRSSD